jgi:hypothetical protein
MEGDVSRPHLSSASFRSLSFQTQQLPRKSTNLPPRWDGKLPSKHSLKIHRRLVFRFHVRKAFLLTPPPRVVRRAARAFERAHVILVKAEQPLDLLTAVVEIGPQVFVEFGAGVHLGLQLRRYTSIEAALDTLQVGLLHDEQSGVDGGGYFGG